MTSTPPSARDTPPDGWTWPTHGGPMQALFRQPPDRLGRRGATLLLLSLIWVGIGVGTYLNPDTARPEDALLYERLPDGVRLALWAGTGTVAAIYAWRRPGTNDGPGFVALILMPVERAACYVWSTVVYVAQDGAMGLAYGWLFALVWGVITLLVVTVAGWPEPPTPPKVRRRA